MDIVLIPCKGLLTYMAVPCSNSKESKALLSKERYIVFAVRGCLFLHFIVWDRGLTPVDLSIQETSLLVMRMSVPPAERLTATNAHVGNVAHVVIDNYMVIKACHSPFIASNSIPVQRNHCLDTIFRLSWVVHVSCIHYIRFGDTYQSFTLSLSH